jgi:hypothetical protein
MNAERILGVAPARPVPYLHPEHEANPKNAPLWQIARRMHIRMSRMRNALHRGMQRRMKISNQFLVDLEIPLREMADLAMAKWMAAHSPGSNNSELANLTDQFLERATRTEVCWTIASLSAQRRRTG